MCTIKYTFLSLIRSPFNCLLVGIVIFGTCACRSGSKNHRPSPLAGDSTSIDDVELSILYSSPGVKKRKIWGELVPYGEIWRTGANEATVFTTSSDILLNDQVISAGKYSVFTITSDSTWTIIFNEDWDQWGSFNYEESKDVLRLKVTPRKSDYTERMSFTFEDSTLTFEWENLSYQMRIDAQP